MQTSVQVFVYVVTFVMGVSLVAAEPLSIVKNDSGAASISLPVLDVPVMALLFDASSDLEAVYVLLGVDGASVAENQRLFFSNNVLGDCPFDQLIARASSHAVKYALTQYKNGSAQALLMVLKNGTAAEQQSALACCAVMLGAVGNALVFANRDALDGVTTCINLIQIYEQVEQLPIESTLQSIRFLYQRICLMLAQLSDKEESFIGWLKNKWVYLPVVVIIIMLRIAKFYWGGQHNNLYDAGYYGSYGNNQFSSQDYGMFGSSNQAFASRGEEENSTVTNAEVIVGSA